MKTPSPKTKELSLIKEEIRQQLCNLLDGQCIEGLIISQNLKIAEKGYGSEVKDTLIDEFGLEQRGWDKKSKVIKRSGEFNFKF
jgi:hypothetical protein